MWVAITRTPDAFASAAPSAGVMCGVPAADAQSAITSSAPLQNSASFSKGNVSDVYTNDLPRSVTRTA